MRFRFISNVASKERLNTFFTAKFGNKNRKSFFSDAPSLGHSVGAPGNIIFSISNQIKFFQYQTWPRGHFMRHWQRHTVIWPIMIIIMVIIIMITIISSPPQTLASDHMRHKGDQGSELSPQSGSTYTDCTQPGTCRIHYFRICFEIFICCVKT